MQKLQNKVLLLTRFEENGRTQCSFYALASPTPQVVPMKFQKPNNKSKDKEI